MEEGRTILLAGLKVCFLVQNAMVTSSGMNKDSQDIATQPAPTVERHLSKRQVRSPLQLKPRQIQLTETTHLPSFLLLGFEPRSPKATPKRRRFHLTMMQRAGNLARP